MKCQDCPEDEPHYTHIAEWSIYWKKDFAQNYSEDKRNVCNGHLIDYLEDRYMGGGGPTHDTIHHIDRIL